MWRSRLFYVRKSSPAPAGCAVSARGIIAEKAVCGRKSVSKRLVAVLSAMWLLVLAVSLMAAAYNYMSGARYAEAVSTADGGRGEKFEQLEMIYDTLLRDYYIELDPTELAEGAIQGMLAATGDPYTFYYTADEWAEELSALEGEYAGIGVQVLEDAEAGALMIARAYADSPAYRAGLRAGDMIVAVDGYSVAAALRGADGGADAPANRTELIEYMRGAEGSSVTLTIERAGERFERELEREVIHINRVEYRMLDGGDGLKIGYMVIYEFQGDAAEGVARALEHFQAQGAQALVVDLRNNPGGELGVVTSIVEQLLPEGMYAYIEDRHGNRQEFYSESEGWGRPMAVLVNGYSASASELFTGAAKDMGAAVIVGETTFGKGIVQSVIALADGSGYQFTSARYFTPSGHVIQGNGIEPDVRVELDGEYDASTLSAMIAEGDIDWRSCDAQLREAYDALADQLAAATEGAQPGEAAATEGARPGEAAAAGGAEYIDAAWSI